MTKTNVPRLRFKGFDGEWQSGNIGDKLKVVMGQSPHSENYTSDSNQNILVQGNADILNGKIKPRIYTSEITKVSKKNEIIMTVRAPVGELALNQFDDVVIGRGVASLSGNSFDYFLLDRIKKMGIWNRFSSGSTFDAVNSNDIKTMSISFPKINEQQKIGSFFTKIDQLIELQTQKLEQLKKLKQGYLQKMFPQDGKALPILRFSGFSGDWIQKALSDIGAVYGGLSGKTKEDFGHGNSRFVPYISLNRNYVSNDNNTELVNVEDSEKQNLVQKNDVLFTISSETPEEVGLSSTWLGDKKTYLNSFSFGYRFNSPTDGYFTSSLLRSRDARSKIYPLAQGISRYNLSKKAFLGLKFRFPILDEQKKIGSFLSKQDQMINNQSDKIEALKQQKKAYLQKMFI